MQKFKINILGGVIYDFDFGASFSRRVGEHAFKPIRQKDIQASERHNDTSATQTSSSSFVCSFVTSRCCRKIGPPGVRGKKKKKEIKAEERGAKRDAKHKSCEEEGVTRGPKTSIVCSVSLELVRSFAHSPATRFSVKATIVRSICLLPSSRKKERRRRGNTNSWPCTRTRPSWTIACWRDRFDSTA